MSKSKGNVIDPLDIAEKYGTDALRIALIFSTAAGNDIPMSEDKVRRMKFFTNKLWNMARFISMNRISNFKFQISKHPVQKPPIRLLHAKEPEAIPLLIFHIEIIPRPIVSAPPFPADPLRPGRVTKLVNVVFMAK